MVDKKDEGFDKILSMAMAFLFFDSISCFNFILSSDKNASSVAENIPFIPIKIINNMILNSLV